MKATLALAGFLVVGSVSSHAAITGITEMGLAGDTPAIVVNGGFAEDALTFSDRDHQHNGAAFDGASGLLSTTGTNIVPLPSYLVGGDYIRFANNARDNNPYSATITADESYDWFVLIDNRLNGVTGQNNQDNTTDPVLGGTLQWVLDDNWQRVNTGISPGGQADYTAVDETGGGLGVGAGVSLNQFYSIYTRQNLSSVTIGGVGIGGNNMLALVGTPTVVPEPSSLAFIALGMVGILRRRR